MMENIIKKLNKELEFAQEMQREYEDKIVYEAENRSAHLAMNDFYNGMAEAYKDAISFVKEEQK